MKLVRENFIVFYLLLIFGIVIIEILFAVFTFIYSKKFFNETFDEAANVSRYKITLLTEILNNSTLKLFSKFRSDLILVAKHMILLKDINTNLQYYKNYEGDDIKRIISSNYDEIMSNSILKHYYNNITHSLDYIRNYEFLYRDILEPNLIIDLLFNESVHKELDLISYYNLNNNNVNNTYEKTNIFGKYLISILKSIYIGRYFAKRMFSEYLRFIFFHENECFIYPPELYNHTQSYEFSKSYLNSDNFPYSIYSYLNDNLKDNYFFYTINTGTNLIVCLSIPYFYDINFTTKENVGYICIEIDITNILRDYKINNGTKLEILAIANQDLSTIYFDGRSLNLLDLASIFNTSFSDYQFKNFSRKTLFHLLYYNLFESNSHKVNINEIIEEYTSIYDIFINEINNFINSTQNHTNNVNETRRTIYFYINKTNCHSSMYNNKQTCKKEQFLVVINPLIVSNAILDNNFFVQTSTKKNYQNAFYSIAVLGTNEDYSKNKVHEIMFIKLLKIFLYFLLICCGIATCVSLFLMLIFRCYYNGLDDIIKELETFLFYIKKKYTPCTLNKFSRSSNKEMNELSKIFNSININYILKKTIENQTSILEITQDLTQNLNHIKNKDIKNRYIMIIAHYYYEKGFYEKAENQFSSLINYINEKENSYLINNEYDENKIKDTISRTSSSTYLNEYSTFKGISDNILTIIKIKLTKQKINYLHGMCIFKILLQNNKNKSNIFNNRKKNENYLQEAIKNFTQCREINSALGINPIIEIFSLIMMSRCYMIISNYKKAISNLTDALILFERLTEIFKDESGEKFNPKVMFFILNFIFQSIMFTISQVCFFFNKNYACNWISIKILETSPFIINSIFLENCFFSQNSIRTILKRKTLSTNANTAQIQSYYSKIFSRINIKFRKEKCWKERLNLYNFANPLTTTMKRTSIKLDLTKSENLKSILAKESKFFLKKSKLITICISEKVILNLNGTELKDVIVKYLQKFFTPNDNDSFSFIQFTFNGKKSIYLKPERLDLFLKRLQTNKDALKLTEYLTNNEVLLNELFNLFDFMIKQQKEEYSNKNNSSTLLATNQNSSSIGNSSKNKNSSEAHNSSDHKKSIFFNNINNLDKIILLFLKSDELRFNSQEECIHIVNDLNKNNCTVIIFCYDEEIKMDKIFNIYCLLGGLFDGYFFQIKNYQQIKQVLMNFSTYNYQENFANLNFENLELIL